MSHGSSTHLRLTLFGPPQITRADGTAVTFRLRKHLALLAYLAVEQQHPQSREKLVGLLWPDAPKMARAIVPIPEFFVLENLERIMAASPVAAL